MADVNATRGSEKLLAQLSQKGTGASPEEVKTALSIPQESKFTIDRYYPRGVPPYFEVEATLFGPISELGAAVNQLAVNSSLRNINILINGIPKPEIAEVTVNLAGRVNG